MRENRPHGSEGGEAKAFPTPIAGPHPHPVLCDPFERDRLRCHQHRNSVGQAFIQHCAMVGAKIRQRVVVDRYAPA